MKMYAVTSRKPWPVPGFCSRQNQLAKKFRVTAALRLNIKRGDDFKPLLLKTAIGKQRKAEIPDADEDHRLKAVGAQQIGDHLGQLFDFIAQAAGAELAEIGEILAKLRRLDAGGGGERVAGDGADRVRLEPVQAAQVNGQTINRLAGNLGTARFLHVASQLNNPAGRKQVSEVGCFSAVLNPQTSIRWTAAGLARTFPIHPVALQAPSVR